MNCRVGLFLLCLTYKNSQGWKTTPEDTLRVRITKNIGLGFSGDQALSTVKSHNRTVMCVFDSWAIDREGHGKFGVENVNTDLCTHLILRSAEIYEYGTRNYKLRPIHPYLSKLTRKAVGLKKQHQKLKVILSVGGRKEDFRKISSSDVIRWNFADSIAKFLKKLELDGLNVEWMWPEVEVFPIPHQNGGWSLVFPVTYLIESLSTVLKAQQLELGLTLPSEAWIIENGYDIPALNGFVDYFIIKGYMTKNWWQFADHHSPLYPVTLKTVGQAVVFVLDKNISSRKLILGIPFKGRAFKLTYGTKGNGLGAHTSYGNSLQGAFNKDDEVLNYNEICRKLREPKNEWTVYEDIVAKVPFMRDRDGNWVSFDDTKSVQAKVEFGEKHRLGGYAAWSITNDDFNGNLCGNITYPLLRTINYVLSKNANLITTESSDSSDTTSTTTVPDEFPPLTTTKNPLSRNDSLETTTSQTILPPSSISTHSTSTIKPTSQRASLETTASQTINISSSISTQPTSSTKPTSQNASFDFRAAQPTLPQPRKENDGWTEISGTDGGSSVVIYVVVTLLGMILLLVVVFFLVRRKRNGNKNELSNSEISRFKKGYNHEDVKHKRNTQAILLEQLQAENNINCSPYDNSLEIPPTEYEIYADEILGSGAYGVVLRGKVRNEVVAVKTVKSKSSKDHVLSLMEEIKVMTYLGKHEHILGLIGANTASLHRGIVYVFAELSPLGSLEKYLKVNKLSFVDLMKNDEFACEKSRLEEDGTEISTATLLIWAHQISNAMQFLACKKVIHGDLGTRNVRVCRKYLVKISDLVSSRKMHAYCNCINNNYVNHSEDPLPWRHMSLETLTNLEFSTKSDVWAFGVTLWEIFSLGALPYPGMSYTFGFTDDLMGGRRMSKPRHATTEMYEKTMLQTWNEDPHDRPSFEELCSFLHDAVERVSFQQEYVKVNAQTN